MRRHRLTNQTVAVATAEGTVRRGRGGRSPPGRVRRTRSRPLPAAPDRATTVWRQSEQVQGPPSRLLRNNPNQKADLLSGSTLSIVRQAEQLKNPDARVALERAPSGSLLERYARSYKG